MFCDMIPAASAPRECTVWISALRSAFVAPGSYLPTRKLYAVDFRKAHPVLERVVFEQVHRGTHAHDTRTGVVPRTRPAAVVDELEGGRVDSYRPVSFHQHALGGLKPEGDSFGMDSMKVPLSMPGRRIPPR